MPTQITSSVDLAEWLKDSLKDKMEGQDSIYVDREQEPVNIRIHKGSETFSLLVNHSKSG